MHLQKMGFEDLDRHLLVRILSYLDPSPDLFNATLCCKRFAEVASSGELWLEVCLPGYKRVKSAGHRKLNFDTLEDAVAASRRGDTIVIQPQQRHFSEQIVIQHPLRILGGGEKPEETHIGSLTLLKPCITFRASGEICNLSMTASMGPCVEHRQGSVRIDKCVLESVPETGLEHLCSPIVSRTGLCLSDLGTLDGVDSIMARTHLYVDETVIRGANGMRAVDGGWGQLSDVRAVGLFKDTLYWFTVSPGSSRVSSIPQHANDLDGCLPLWAQGEQPPFPASADCSSRAMKRKAALLGADNEAQQLQSKAKHWTRQAVIHASLNDRSTRQASESREVESNIRREAESYVE